MKNDWTIWGGRPHELVGGRWEPRTLGRYVEHLMEEERARRPPLWLQLLVFAVGFIVAFVLRM